MTGYDVIGDVHGMADKLVGLLRRLGYRERRGAWRHPERQAVFVGDLIDRGPQQIETLEIVRCMVDAGTARVTMGNHEFNAISWATPDPARPGDSLRTQLGEKGKENRFTHQAFLEQVGEGSPLHQELLAWFATLPLWLDLDGLRIVHACWHEESMKALPAVDADRPMSEEFVIAANAKGTATWQAIETVLKGPEVELGEAWQFVDTEGHSREAARIKWWDATAVTLRLIADIPPKATTPSGDPVPPLPDEPVPMADEYRYVDDVPVVFGHYWWTGPPEVAGPTTVCVDFSAVRGGPLVAYRWDGEPTPDNANFEGFDDDEA